MAFLLLHNYTDFIFDDNYKLLRLPMSRVKTLIQWETEDASSVQDDELPF